MLTFQLQIRIKFIGCTCLDFWKLYVASHKLDIIEYRKIYFAHKISSCQSHSMAWFFLE